MSAQPNFVTTVNNSAVQLSSSTAGRATVFTAGTSGSWLRAVNVCSESKNSYKLKFKLVLSATSSPILCEVTVPAADKNGPKPINIMDPRYIPAMDPAPNRGLMLAAGQALAIEIPETSYLKLASSVGSGGSAYVYKAAGADSGISLTESRVNEDSLILSIPDDQEGYLTLFPLPYSAGDEHFTRRVRLMIDPTTNALVSPEGLSLGFFDTSANTISSSLTMPAGTMIHDVQISAGGLVTAKGVNVSSTELVALAYFEAPSVQLEAESGLAAGDTIDVVAFGGDF